MSAKIILPLFTAVALLFGALSPSAFAAGTAHKVAIHVLASGEPPLDDLKSSDYPQS